MHLLHIKGMQRSKTVTWKNPNDSSSLNQKLENPASKLEAMANPDVMPRTV
jgi:hypothetical protein